ncbi:MAG TPA: 3-oxoacyl-ACP reductase family protein [Bacillota bacterium]|nr:3-oxoacyl-ACP reductase family protein [Bacillota bacterium]
MKLKNKVAIVTGAGQGIGKSVALAFAKEGAHLSLNYFGTEQKEMDEFIKELESYGIRAIAMEGDLSKNDTAKSLVDQTIHTFDRVDILANVAGISDQGPVQDLDEEAWDTMIDVNLKSVFLTTKYAVAHMISQKSGRIINFSSNLGQKGGVEVSHYAASKAGVIGFTKSIALELGPHGITANCVAPGPTETPMLADFDADWRKEKLAELPLQRFGQVDEIIPTVVLLASDPDGNAFTGQTLSPNVGDVML